MKWRVAPGPATPPGARRSFGAFARLRLSVAVAEAGLGGVRLATLARLDHNLRRKGRYLRLGCLCYCQSPRKAETRDDGIRPGFSNSRLRLVHAHHRSRKSSLMAFKLGLTC
ncbi:hypothetical protein DENSPDRAFT_298445 [Dentipellis sp. KUC8613]|nr:hypothetical protein DENSPDRAFT_298445 [Dentipellis sp. KUC8613]